MLKRSELRSQELMYTAVISHTPRKKGADQADNPTWNYSGVAN